MPTGIDSFTNVPPAVVAKAGHSFVVRYLTDLDSSLGHKAKAWTTAQVAACRAAGLGVVAVWEGGEADRTTAWRGGYDRGRRDALRAATQATALGRPDGRPVYFAVDFDVRKAADFAVLAEYFRGIASVFDRQNIGVYGGRLTVEWAQRAGAAAWFWQTGAWSDDYQVPGNHLWQRIPQTRLGAYQIDIDDAHQADYGQWFNPPGGDMPDLWMPGATRLDIGDHSPTDGGPAKALAHITWDRNATAANPADLISYETLVQYFGRNPAGMKAAPHIIWDPFTGRFTQLVPANSRSKSVVDVAGGTRTNRAGKVVLQIEAVFFPYCRWSGRVYARLVDTPCKGWAELNAWVRSWGVPDVWPMGRPMSFAANRSESVWERQAGWYGHSQVPENDHQDPGSWPEFTMMEDDDMTPAQAQQLAELHDALVPYQGWGYQEHGEGPDAWALLQRAADPTTELGYKYAGDVEAAKKAGRPAPPDVYGMIGETRARVDALDAKLDAILATLKAGK
ncbi:DUF1906 domain-containing protein [Embleya sp. NPDC005971]|uniref:DUF1906 domain-containing protein n=1 Tax=Embleya sp. NPDC005971 TaxID=3156724 RepID=UPI0033F97CC3